MKALLCVAFVCALTATLHAAVDVPSASGNDFVRLCSVIDKDDAEKTKLEGLQEIVCVAYVAGLRDGVAAEIAFAESENKSAPKPYCLQSAVENGQLVKIALKYIKGHPE